MTPLNVGMFAMIAAGLGGICSRSSAGQPNSQLKNAIVAFFNVAKSAAKLLTAHKITTCVAIL